MNYPFVLEERRLTKIPTANTFSIAITEAQRSALHDQGYFVLEDVFTPSEMEELSERIEGHQRRHEESIRAGGGVDNISRADEITFTGFLAEQDSTIRAFVRRPEFVAIVTALLGPDVDLYWNQSVFKAPEGNKEFPWHQDDAYTPVVPAPYLTLWIALRDASEENGTISVLPGSHRLGLLPHEKTSIGLSCHRSDDPDQGTVVRVCAGSIAVFWSLTVHKSGVNRSAETRKAYIVQYARAGLRKQATNEVIPNLLPIARGGQPVL